MPPWRVTLGDWILAWNAPRCTKRIDHSDRMSVQIPRPDTTWNFPPLKRQRNTEWARANSRGASWTTGPAPEHDASGRAWSRPPAAQITESRRTWERYPPARCPRDTRRRYKRSQHVMCIGCMHKLNLLRQTNKGNRSSAQVVQAAAVCAQARTRAPKLQAHLPSPRQLTGRTRRIHGNTQSIMRHNRRRHAVQALCRLRKTHGQLLRWHKSPRSLLCHQQNSSRSARVGAGPVDPSLLRVRRKACSMSLLSTGTQCHATRLGAMSSDKEDTQQLRTPARSGTRKTVGKHNASHWRRSDIPQQGQLQNASFLRRASLRRQSSCIGIRGHTQSRKERCWPRVQRRTIWHQCQTLSRRQKLPRRQSPQILWARDFPRRTSHGSSFPCPFGTSVREDAIKTGEAQNGKTKHACSCCPARKRELRFSTIRRVSET